MNEIVTAMLEGMVEGVARVCARTWERDVIEVEADWYEAIAQGCTVKAELARETLARLNAKQGERKP